MAAVDVRSAKPGFQIRVSRWIVVICDAQFLDLASGHGCTRGHVEIERRDHCRADHDEQKYTNPLALNTPGGLSVSMDNLSSLSLHNDLYIWAMVV